MKKLILLSIMVFSSQLSSADQLRLSIGMDYLSGDYGTATDTDIKAMTLTARYKKDRWTMQASMPYLAINGPGVTVDGIPVSGGGNSEQGWGDLTLSLAYLGYYDAGSGIGLSGKAKIKLPVADEDKGLGTGETDYSVQIDPFWVIDKVTLFSTLGYKVYGDTATTDYRDVGFAMLGGMLKVDDITSLGLGGNYRQKVTDSSENKKDLFLFMTHKLTKKDMLDAHMSKGFSDASPDWAAGLAYKRIF